MLTDNVYLLVAVCCMQNAFGADLGVAQVYQHEPLELRVNDNYHHDMHQKTSLSLALQAAAEREIARARREALGGAVDDDSDHFSAHALAAAVSPHRAQPSGPAYDQAAKWLTSREIDEMVEKDRHESFIQGLTDDDARRREEKLFEEKEERRRRREEAKLAEGALGVRMDRDQRIPPAVIDDHVPLADDDTRTGRARFHPPPDYPLSGMEFSLINFSIIWRLFGGQDWSADDEDVQAAAAGTFNSHGEASVSASQPLTWGMEQRRGASVDINDFYAAHEPFVKPQQHPYASPLAGRHSDIQMPPEPYRMRGSIDMQGSSVLQSNRVGDGGFFSSPDVIPRGHRQTDRVMELVLSGVNVRYDAFPSGQQIASRLVVALDNMAVHDLITTSPFNNFLCYYPRPGGRGRELGSSMIRIDLTSVRPDPSRAREEFRVRLSVLPLRLNVDQAAVEFFIQFFKPPEKSADLESSTAATVASLPEGAAIGAPGAVAQFHQLYSSDELPQTPAEGELLAALTQLLLQPGAKNVSRVLNVTHARVLCADMEARKLISPQTVADAIKCSLAHYQLFKSGSAGPNFDQNVGVPLMQLLNRLLRPQRSPDEDEVDSSDEEDESQSAGMGGNAQLFGMGGGRSPIRRLSTDPLESYNSFQVPPMPHDWMPLAIAQHYPNLVPSLHEAYNKYYDTIHASMPVTIPSEMEPWRPASAVLMPTNRESANEFRTRILAAARSAARTQLKHMGATAVREVDNQTYIQSFEVVNKIFLCIDWQPHTFDLRSLRAGDYAQLANLLPLENVEIELKSAKLTGITGFDRVGVELAQLWAHDVAHYQAHRYLAGVQPIRSFVNVGSGAADLVLLPLAHYRQHGSIKRGVQRGLASFLRNVSLESMAAAARLAQGAQTVLESVDDVLTYRPTPLPSHAHSQFAQQRARNARKGRGGAITATETYDATRRKQTYVSKRANPPVSAQEGLRQAYESLSRGLQSAASQMIVVPRDEYQRSGSRGAVRSAIQAMPGAMLSPVIGGLEAVAKVLNGGANSLAPSRVQEHKDKFKPHVKG
jgi:hypothetical protein